MFVLSIFLLSILISDIFYLAVLLAFVMVVVDGGQGASRHPQPAEVHRLRRGLPLPLQHLVLAGQHRHLHHMVIQVTQESILFATSMSLRLFLAIVAFSVLTFTVHPDDLLKILSRFGFKSMTGLSIATRMYPTIAADSGNIEDAMKARGRGVRRR